MSTMSSGRPKPGPRPKCRNSPSLEQESSTFLPCAGNSQSPKSGARGGAHPSRLGSGLVDLEMCEEYLAGSMRDLGREVLRNVRVEFQQVMEGLQKEIYDMKCTVGPASLDTPSEMSVTSLLTQVLDKASQIQKEAQRPVNVDFGPIREEIRNSEMLCLDVHRDLTQRLEDRVTHNVVHKVKLGADAEECLLRTETKMSELFVLQQALTYDFANTAKEVKKIQAQCDKFQEILEPTLDIQFSKHLREQVVCVDFAPVLGQIGKNHQAVNVDFLQVLGEISKIQQALNVDFMEEEAPEDIDEGVEESPRKTKVAADDPSAVRCSESTAALTVKRAGKRKRDYWSQTEPQGVSEASVQTDEAGQTTKAGKKTTNEERVKRNQTVIDKEKEKMKIKPVFADAEAMKQKVRAKLVRPQYTVTDLYHEDGFVQKIAKSWIFENVTFAVILFNAIWIAVDVDNNKADMLIDAHPVFQVAENAFCLYFTFEVGCRFLAFKLKRSCLKDAWFIFDAILVTFMVLETWVMTIFMFIFEDMGSSNVFSNASILRIARMMRISRIARMARLLRAIPELVILLKGIGAAARSVFSFIMLWVIIVYVFAIVFRQITAGTDVGNQYFVTVPDAMNSLMLDGILPDNARLVNDVAGENPLFFPLIMGFILLASLTLMYMLIGVLVDVIGAVATTEKEGMTVRAVACQLREVFESMDRDTESPMSKHEFQKLLAEPEVIDVIQDVNVDVIVLMEMSDMIFEDNDKSGTGLTFESFVDIVLCSRGTNPATVKDMNGQLRVINTMVANCVNGIIVNLGSEFQRLRHDLVKREADEDDLENEESMALGATSVDEVLPGVIEEEEA